VLSRNEKDQGYRVGPGVSGHTLAIVRRIAGGFLMRTQRETDKESPIVEFTYDDGSLARKAKGQPLTEGDVARLCSQGILLPVDGEALFDDAPPQRYRARTIDDGPLPRILDKNGRAVK
jgi:hypothetical protein